MPNPLPLAATPAVPENCHGEPLGAYWKLADASDGASKLPSPIESVWAAMVIRSIKAVLSPPNGFNPTNRIVCVPAATVKNDVWYGP